MNIKNLNINLFTFKKALKFSILVFILPFGKAYSQGNLDFYYRIDGKLSILTINDSAKVVNSNILTVNEDFSTKSQRYFTASEVSDKLKPKENSIFCFGIPNPKNPNKWVCLEREFIGTNYRVFLFDRITGHRIDIIDKNTYDIEGDALVPFTWCTEEEKIYFERAKFDSPYLHKGIYSYKVESGGLIKLSFPEKYLSTPLLSPDGNFFLYTKTSIKTNDPVHGRSDGVAILDINENTEIFSKTTKGSSYEIVGWNNSISKDVTSHQQVQINGFKLPWEAGKTYCVTRDGNIPPTGNIGSASACSNLGSHTYIATDFDTPNNTDDKILAVADGVVTVANFSNQSGGYDPNGYGNWVIITHPNMYRTLYAHLKSVNVTVGDNVSQGCFIGLEGTTGSSSGDHLHFEYEYPGGVSGNLYTTFDDCNCIPHVGYNYTSNNVTVNCQNCITPANDICSYTVPQLVIGNNCNSTSGDISCATQSYTANNCPSGLIQDVWYKFNATSTANYNIKLSPSVGMDGAIEVRSGSCSGTILGCADSGGGNGSDENLVVSVANGNTYYVRVYDYNPPGNTTLPLTTSFDICVTITAQFTATISNVSFPNSIVSGSSLDLDYSINSTSTFNNNILLGASLIRNGIEYSNPENDALVSLSNGLNSKTRTFNLNSTSPSNPPDGIYDVLVALWKDNNGNGVIDPLTDTQLSLFTSNQQLTISSTPTCTTPGTPVNVAGTSTGATSANLSWSAGSPLGSSTRTYYWVVGTSPSVQYGDANRIGRGSTSGTSASISGLSVGTTYYLRVYATTSCNYSNSGYGTSSGFMTTSSGGEDITVTNASVSSSTINAGADFVVSANQNYSGNQLDADLPSFDLDYYLSSDCNLSSNDILLGGDVSSLGSDDPTNAESATLTIPIGTSGGNYYILFVADNDNELIESNENNNITCVPITISGAGEDITVTNAVLSSSSIYPGENFEVSSNHNYSGNQLDANLPSFDLDYYLSSDCNLSSNDILLGGDVSGLGSDDPTNAETEILTIPSGTSQGNYYILFVADSDNELNESNENNNTACIPIEVKRLTSCNSSDFAFLKEIYTKTNGDNWLNNTGWEIIKNHSSPPIGCSFDNLYGINAIELYEVSRVSEVFLQNNNLTGTLPLANGNLSSLITLDFSANQISGSINTSFGLFPQLIQLNLSQNNLTGSFPPELNDNTLLVYFNISGNNLSGPIPNTISDLNSLVYLYLHENNFTGKLPKELGDLPNVQYMGIRDNSFSDCYDANLNKLCPKISNTYLMDNNGNTASWVNFCLNNAGICITCQESLNHSSSANDFSSGTQSFKTNATSGTINLTNKINGNANIDYQAGRYILLEPGFKVDKGAVFKAGNGGCEN